MTLDFKMADIMKTTKKLRQGLRNGGKFRMIPRARRGRGGPEHDLYKGETPHPTRPLTIMGG